MNRRPTANRFFPSCALGLVLFASLLRAGSVTSLSNKATQTGKLTLSTTAVHVDGPAAADVDLPDILEADFTDLPFDVNFFSTTASGVTRLPASWQALQVGPATSAGTASFADGTITMSGDGSDAKTKIDSYFFIGQPWTGSGQWTARITQGDSQNPFGPASPRRRSPERKEGRWTSSLLPSRQRRAGKRNQPRPFQARLRAIPRLDSPDPLRK
jgi:hypothetical protein